MIISLVSLLIECIDLYKFDIFSSNLVCDPAGLFQMSASCAAKGKVTFGPVPPIRIGGIREGFGSVTRLVA